MRTSSEAPASLRTAATPCADDAKQQESKNLLAAGQMTLPAGHRDPQVECASALAQQPLMAPGAQQVPETSPARLQSTLSAH